MCSVGSLMLDMNGIFYLILSDVTHKYNVKGILRFFNERYTYRSVMTYHVFNIIMKGKKKEQQWVVVRFLVRN